MGQVPGQAALRAEDHEARGERVAAGRRRGGGDAEGAEARVRRRGGEAGGVHARAPPGEPVLRVRWTPTLRELLWCAPVALAPPRETRVAVLLRSRDQS